MRIKQYFIQSDENELTPEGIRISSYILASYVALLPITTALTGLIGERSTLSIIAAIYLLAAAVELAIRPEVLFKKEYAFIYLYFFYTLASFFWNRNRVFNWYLTTFLTAALLFLIASCRKYSEKELKLFFDSSLVSVLIVFLATALNFESAVESRLVIKLIGTMDSNFFACGLCVVIALMMAGCLERKRRWMIFMLPLLSLVVFLTGSRGAMLVMMGMYFCWTAAAAGKRKIVFPIIVALLGFALFYSVKKFFLPLAESDILFERVNPNTVISDQGSGRLSIWLAAIRTYLESDPIEKLFGYGHGSFRDAVHYFAPGHDHPYESHNMYVNALIEGGIFGLFFLSLAFMQILHWAVKNKNLWGFLAVIGFALEGVSLDAQIYQVFPWAFIVAAIYKGGENYEIRFSADGVGDRPGLQG